MVPDSAKARNEVHSGDRLVGTALEIFFTRTPEMEKAKHVVFHPDPDNNQPPISPSKSNDSQTFALIDTRRLYCS